MHTHTRTQIHSASVSTPLHQLMKLGLMNPDQPLSEEVTLVYNQIWANNGDAISRQYAGTAAMKVMRTVGVNAHPDID